jgi:hypothetical protein
MGCRIPQNRRSRAHPEIAYPSYRMYNEYQSLWFKKKEKEKDNDKKILEQLLWLNLIFFKMTSLFAKLSLFVVYHRLFNPPISRLVLWTRNINLGNGFVVVTYYFSAFLVIIFQSQPIPKSWDKKLDG